MHDRRTHKPYSSPQNGGRPTISILQEFVKHLKQVWNISDEPEEVLMYACDLADSVPDTEKTKVFVSYVQQCKKVMDEFLESVMCDGHP